VGGWGCAGFPAVQQPASPLSQEATRRRSHGIPPANRELSRSQTSLCDISRLDESKLRISLSHHDTSEWERSSWQLGTDNHDKVPRAKTPHESMTITLLQIQDTLSIVTRSSCAVFFSDLPSSPKLQHLSVASKRQKLHTNRHW
jgi:hypothetical protein